MGTTEDPSPPPPPPPPPRFLPHECAQMAANFLLLNVSTLVQC